MPSLGDLAIPALGTATTPNLWVAAACIGLGGGTWDWLWLAAIAPPTALQA